MASFAYTTVAGEMAFEPRLSPTKGARPTFPTQLVRWLIHWCPLVITSGPQPIPLPDVPQWGIW